MEAYTNGTGGPYIEWDMVTACIRIAKDHFKEHFLDNRTTRKKLQPLLENYQNRLSEKRQKIEDVEWTPGVHSSN